MTARGEVGSVAVRRWDVAVVLWLIFWAAAGVATYYEIWQLTALSGSVMDSGHAIGTAGRALQDLGDTPLVGHRITQLGNEVSATASGIVQSGQTAEHSIRIASILIGLAVGIGPAGPVLLAYLPSRRLWRRTNEALIRATQAPGRCCREQELPGAEQPGTARTRAGQ